MFGIVNANTDTIAIVAPAGTELIGKFAGSLTMGAQEEMIISCDGTNWTVIGDNGSVGLNVLRFASSGTYTPSSNCASFLVCVTGASGKVAGGGYGVGSGGSGGGGYSEKYYSSPAASYSFTIGSAGTGSPGHAGTTSFDVISIPGSLGGTNGSGTSGVSGSGGDFNATGGNGGNAGGADHWGYNNAGGGGAAGSRAGNGGNGGNGNYSAGGGGASGGGGCGNSSHASGSTNGTPATSENASVYTLNALTLTTFAGAQSHSYAGSNGSSSEGTYTDAAGNTIEICGGGGGAGGGKPSYSGGYPGMDGQITILEFY